MKARLAIAGVLVAVVALVVVGMGAKGSSGGTYQVRAIFDNASFVIPGEDVKIAGSKVGKVSSLGVTKDKKAAITLDITQPGFADFRQDAHCTVRPESLIGEQFVECSPTVPKAPGQSPSPRLKKIPSGHPGAGSYLLPIQNTSSPVDVDIIADAMRLPYTQRLSLIIDELGTGLAANGDELNAVIHRANPALGELDKVLAIVGQQNQVLAKLARDSDTALAPLARDRHQVAGFVDQASQVAEATAERRGDLEANLERLPTFLAELRKTAPRITGLADQAIPVLQDLHAHSSSINSLIEQTGPFSAASRPAVRALGHAAKIGGPALVETLPLTKQLRTLAVSLRPVAANAAKLLGSFESTGGIERLMDYIFYQASAVNGEDAFGHYLRAGLITNGVAQCSVYRGASAAGASAGQTVPPDGACTAQFPSVATASKGARATAASSSQGAGTDPTLIEIAKILKVDAARKKAGKPGLTPREAAKMWAASPAGQYNAANTASGSSTGTSGSSTGTSGSSTGTSGSSTGSSAPATGAGGSSSSGGSSSGGGAASNDSSAGLLDYLLGGSSK